MQIHVELRVTVVSDKPIDHDKVRKNLLFVKTIFSQSRSLFQELDKAILAVTNLNQNATVDKIDARPPF